MAALFVALTPLISSYTYLSRQKNTFGLVNVALYNFQTQIERILVFKGNCQVISMLYNNTFFILYTDSQIIWFFFNSYEIKYNKTDIRHPCVIPFVILNVLDNHSLPFMLNCGFLYDIFTHLRNWSIILKVFSVSKRKLHLQIKKPFHLQKIKICRLRFTNCNIQILNDHFHLSWVEIMTHSLVMCNICQKYKLLMLLQKKGMDQTRILHFSFQWPWTWPNNIVSKSIYMYT